MTLDKTKARFYCFTLNNPTQEEMKKIEAIKADDLIRYLIYGEEIGESKTPHLQGYIELHRQCRMPQVKKLLSDRVHLEKRKGTRSQAIDYCKKDGKFHEVGQISLRPGQRNDLAAIVKRARTAKTFTELCEEHPASIRFPRSYQLIRKEELEHNAPKWRDLKVYVYVGPTGTGKTKKAMDHPDVYKLDMANQLWFDGYEGQSRLVIDDFYGWIKYGTLLNLLDGYKMRLELKGSFTYAHYTEVIITSNKEPTDWYQREEISALMRRVTNVEHFDE